MEGSREQRIFEKLEEVLDQGRKNAAALQLTKTMLFGSEEDDFKAGRLPQLESKVKLIEEGRGTATRTGLKLLSKGVLVGLGAIIHACLGIPSSK